MIAKKIRILNILNIGLLIVILISIPFDSAMARINLGSQQDNLLGENAKCTVENVEITLENIEIYIGSDEVDNLLRYFQGKNLTPKKENTTKTRLICTEVAEYIEFYNTPLLDTNGVMKAHIAAWDGYWNGTKMNGAIGAYEDDLNRIFLLTNGKITSFFREEWFEQQPIRIDSIIGPTPKMKNDLETEEISKSTSSTFQQFDYSPNYSEICVTTDRHQTGKTVLGFVAFEFHQRVNWCHTGSSYNIQGIYTYVSQVDQFSVYRGVVGSWNDPKTYYHTSFRQGHFENCIPFVGCLSSAYPSVTIRVYVDGYIEEWLGW
jgi:hypothetical protein